MTARTSNRGSVIVAMSGGVDSSVAAALLLDQGHGVTGVTLRLWAGDEPETLSPESCRDEAVIGARNVCQMLGIPHHVMDLTREFEERVVDQFVRAYAGGRTPNPCIACNRHVKFHFLLEWARATGFRWVATGHYARVVPPGPQEEQTFRLLRGVDRDKDQSYVLYMLGQEELPRLLFPLGDLTKEQVRREARARNLPAAGRPESQEICFIPDNDYRRFLAQRMPEAIQRGPIRALDGQILGTHRGLAHYTVGQRKGLGLPGMPHPLYVVGLAPAENTLIVGPREALFSPALEAEEVSFISGSWPESPLRVTAKVRYRADAAPARLLPLDRGRVHLQFERPQRAVTPGQTVVFYGGETVLGGGTITRPLTLASAFEGTREHETWAGEPPRRPNACRTIAAAVV
jgi:tRNA-specific 2-thiouridylase